MKAKLWENVNKYMKKSAPDKVVKITGVQESCCGGILLVREGGNNILLPKFVVVEIDKGDE